MTRSRSVALRRALFGAILVTLAVDSRAQVATWHAHGEPVSLDSGARANPLPVPIVVWRQFVVATPRTPWMRVCFAHANLPPGSRVRLVSLLDGAEQRLEQIHVEQWAFRSAYFNGNAVLVELEATGNSAENRVVIDRIWAGDDPDTVQQIRSICGLTDDRIPGSHPAIGRTDLGCTGWIIQRPTVGDDKCHLSAGHCFPGSNVIEFFPPLSNANCSLVHPHPNQQFAIDTGGVRFANAGPGDDWAAFRCFRNPNTGLTTFQTMGASIQLATVIPPVNTIARVTGYGTDNSEVNGAPNGEDNCTCEPRDGTGRRNQYQQTHNGPITAVSATLVQYRLDTCGGNSGSPVFEDGPVNHAIAIHTHGGCLATGGSNRGTPVTKQAVQNAILAVCLSGGGGPIPNDLCSAPTRIDLGANGPYSNVGATASGPTFACGTAGSDVWFDFVPTCTGPHVLGTCTSTRTVDTVLELFGGTCGTLTSLGCSDDVCAAGSSLTRVLNQGQRYLVRVGGRNGAQGAFDLSVQPGTGTGSITRLPTGCGGLQFGSTGSPALGALMTFQLSGTSGTPYLVLGLGVANQALCPPSPCRLGPAPVVALPGNRYELTIPCNAALVGVTVVFQGADVFVPTGCPALQTAFSDTIVAVVG